MLNQAARLFRALRHPSRVVTRVFGEHPLWHPLKMTAEGRQWLATLRRDGIVKIEGEIFQQAASHCLETYFNKIEAPSPHALGDIPMEPPLFAKFYKQYCRPAYPDFEYLFALSFKDPGLTPLLFYPDLLAVVNNYYRSQAYWRANPALHKLTSVTEPTKERVYHVDSVREVMLMVFVNDVYQENSHMEYLLGTHDLFRYPAGTLIRESCLDSDVRNRPRFHCIGKAGTAFLFDSGGIHARVLVPGPCRKALHLAYLKESGRSDFLEAFPSEALQGMPTYLRRMFSGQKKEGH